MGEKGGGFIGTTIKDKWTKAGGWKWEGGGDGWDVGEGWGGKAENCT